MAAQANATSFNGRAFGAFLTRALVIATFGLILFKSFLSWIHVKTIEDVISDFSNNREYFEVLHLNASGLPAGKYHFRDVEAGSPLDQFLLAHREIETDYGFSGLKVLTNTDETESELCLFWEQAIFTDWSYAQLCWLSESRSVYGHPFEGKFVGDCIEMTEADFRLEATSGVRCKLSDNWYAYGLMT